MNLTEDNSGFIRRLFLRHVSPGVAAQVISIISPIVFGVMAGSLYGKTGLAVIGLFAPFFFLAGFFGTIIASGSATMAAKYIARDDERRVSGIYTLALGLSLLCAGVLFGLGVLFRDPILSMLARNGDLLKPVADYYIPSLWYTCFTVIVYVPLFWARLLGKSLISLVLTFILTGVSIILGVFYTYVLQLGLEALAIAQAVATALAVVVSLLLLHFPENGLRTRFPHFIRKDTAEMILAGSPPGLSRLYRFLSLIYVNAVLLDVSGIEAVAIFGILNMLLRFITAISNGISGVQMPIAGVLYEERDSTSLRQLARVSFLSGNAAILVSAGLILLFHQGIAVLFGADNSLLFPALICFCIYLPFYINGSLSISWYTAVRRLKIANVITLAQDLAFPTFLAAVFLYMLSGINVWLHLPVSGAITIVLLLLMRYQDKAGSVSTDTAAADTSLAFSVERSPDKAGEASAVVGDYCEEQGMDRRKSMLLSMAIEEMVVLIAEQNPDGGDLSVRLTGFNGGTIMRLRDTGQIFNPIAYYQEQLLKADDIEDSISLMGVKYITEAAEVVYYRETFGVNNLVIII